MGSTSLRIFFISDDDEIFRISNTKFDRMINGSSEEKIEMFSGKRIRVAEIVLKMVNRTPVQVLSGNYFYLHFDDDGFVDYDRLMKDCTISIEAFTPGASGEKADGNIINAHSEFAKRRRDHSIRWEPNMDLERNLFDASIDEFKCKQL